jgi:transcriptional regulator with XRE-family HTH domain
MAKPLAPEVRSQFAKRLKEMRAQAGFVRARHLAKALGIEENRYTRYERAEVEPSLTLIHKMCEILRVSPDELLGFAESEGPAVPGFQENAPRGDSGRGPLLADRLDAQPMRNLAWRLAGMVAEARHQRGSTANGAGDPLALPRETAKLFQALERDPFGTVASVAADEALQALDSDTKAELADLIKAYTDGIARPTRPRPQPEK